ncbi:hypothetical protein SNOD_34255 [Streptomyces nodosus]|uniref:Uncharacterized protein n=1 Tax=Streptomyces nodosus TaxID=40318 RepID=A0A0B5DL59_9ACTN|nr:hypothetical protein SNOD_34255 [Streptomyces nodosus]
MPDVRLLGPNGGGEVVLAGHLFADPGFAVIGADVPRAAPQWGLFETAPAAAREKAPAWQRHVREVECGLPGGPGSEGAVRPQYDAERKRALSGRMYRAGRCGGRLAGRTW